MKLVLRTTQQCGVPPLDVLRLNKDGSGESIAWFWRENEAREYINMHSGLHPRYPDRHWDREGEREGQASGQPEHSPGRGVRCHAEQRDKG